MEIELERIQRVFLLARRGRETVHVYEDMKRDCVLKIHVVHRRNLLFRFLAYQIANCDRLALAVNPTLKSRRCSSTNE